MIRRATHSAAALAWATPVLCEVAALARSVVLARMLGAEELGKTMLLALALRLAEMACDFSIERLLMQAPDGDRPRFRNSMQGAVLLRGALLSGLMLCAALPMAAAFADGPGIWTFAALAIVPMLRGLVHLDYRARERDFDYRGTLIVEGGAALVMLAAAPLAVMLIDDHRALVAVFVAQASAQVILSHVVAQTPWHPVFEMAALRRVVRFGAPLLLNSVLMLLILQGDRMIVIGFFDWADAGRYGIAIQLALLPAQIAGRAASSLLAPAFRRAIAAGSLNVAMTRALRIYICLGLAFVASYAVIAGPAIAFVYGADFTMPFQVFLALGALAGLRIARTPLSQAAVALGRTAVPAKANFFRALALPVVLVAAWAGAPLATIAAIGAVGEALAAWRAAHLLHPEISTPTQHRKMEGLA